MVPVIKKLHLHNILFFQISLVEVAVLQVKEYWARNTGFWLSLKKYYLPDLIIRNTIYFYKAAAADGQATTVLSFPLIARGSKT